MIKSKNLTGGQAAIKSLKKEKVKHIFGLIGSATMEMFDALYHQKKIKFIGVSCLLYTSPSPRDRSVSRMPSSA